MFCTSKKSQLKTSPFLRSLDSLSWDLLFHRNSFKDKYIIDLWFKSNLIQFEINHRITHPQSATTREIETKKLQRLWACFPPKSPPNKRKSVCTTPSRESTPSSFKYLRELKQTGKHWSHPSLSAVSGFWAMQLWAIWPSPDRRADKDWECNAGQ